MKTKINRKQIVRLFAIGAIALLSFVQTNAQSVLKKFSYEITLLGTSNIHDRTMKSSGSNLDGYFNLNAATKQLESIQPLTFNMPVKSLKSKENLLNSRAYEALKADKYPNISFKLLNTKASGSQIHLNGQLTVAGVTKDVTLVANTQKNADGSIVLSGSQKLKITDFGLNPPKYMMGMMKVYNDLTVNYTVRF